jgi:hypothetical protein
MTQSFSEANGRSTGQEIPRLLWTPQFRYCVYRHQTLNWARWIQSTHWYLFKIVRNIFLPFTPDLPSGLTSSRFPTRILYAFVTSQMHAARSVRLDFITLKLLPGEYFDPLLTDIHRNNAGNRSTLYTFSVSCIVGRAIAQAVSRQFLTT